jgi:hypothetical protein
MTALAHQLAGLIGPFHGYFSASRHAAKQCGARAKNLLSDPLRGCGQLRRLISGPLCRVNAKADNEYAITLSESGPMHPMKNGYAPEFVKPR